MPDAEGNAPAVRAMEGLIAPLQLPPALRRLWELVGPWPMGPEPEGVVRPFELELCDPAVSYQVWRSARDRPGLVPDALVQVGRWGPWFRFVELADTAGDGGGAVYEWTFGEHHATLIFASVEDWIEALAELVEKSEQHPNWRGQWVWIDHQRLAELGRERLGRDPEKVDLRPPARPERWRAAARLVDDRRAPARKVMSISELVWSPPGEARISGMIDSYIPVSSGERLRIVDGTGMLSAWCPVEVEELSLRRDHRAFDFDVTTEVTGWPEDAAEERRNHFERAVLTSPPEVIITAMAVRILG